MDFPRVSRARMDDPWVLRRISAVERLRLPLTRHCGRQRHLGIVSGGYWKESKGDDYLIDRAHPRGMRVPGWRSAILTDTPPRPKRRRWRWLAAAVLLFAVAAAVWWYWPVGDARFVGRWTSQLGANGYWEFRPNGIAVWNTSSPNSPGRVAGYTTWQVKKNILQLGDPLIKPSQSWRAWTLHQWNNLLPFNPWIVDSVSFRVVDVGPDKIVLLSTDFKTDDGDTETLNRIRE